MSHRSDSRNTPTENLRIIIRIFPWRFLLVVSILVIVAIPTYTFGAGVGLHLLPNVTNLVGTLGGSASPVATPLPLFPTVLPQPGSLPYTALAGDSCDEILAFQMRMADAGQVFSDANPNTVQALNAAIGHDCHKLQPGIALTLSPQYPLLAFGGVVLKIDATSTQQVLPTPLVPVPQQQQKGIDCSSGCQLTVRIAPNVQVHLLVQTIIPVRIGSWVWAQAMFARKSIPGFANYPYVDPTTSLDSMSLHACDLQVGNTHDDNSLSCNQLFPNTINDDGGAWLFSVTGPGGVDHWHYPLQLSPGTRILLWLSASRNGDLTFRKGNPMYRYDERTQIYVQA